MTSYVIIIKIKLGNLVLSHLILHYAYMPNKCSNDIFYNNSDDNNLMKYGNVT